MPLPIMKRSNKKYHFNPSKYITSPSLPLQLLLHHYNADSFSVIFAYNTMNSGYYNIIAFAKKYTFVPGSQLFAGRIFCSYL